MPLAFMKNKEERRSHNKNKWTVTLVFISVLAVLVFWQSDNELADGNNIVVGDVDIKTAKIRGIQNESNHHDDDDDNDDDDDEVFENDDDFDTVDDEHDMVDDDEDDNVGVGGEIIIDEIKVVPDEPKDALEKVKQSKTGPTGDCTSMCLARIEQHHKKWGGDLLKVADLQRLVKDAQNKLIARLQVNYGKEHYTKIFESTGAKHALVSAGDTNNNKDISMTRFRRKLKLKILTMQESVRQEQASLGTYCDCKSGDKTSNGSSSSINNIKVPPLQEYYERFVWATGGHSSAAGHGNLWNQSYTAFMEQAVADVFGAIGIDFEGRNYAMGGTNAAPEIALCSEAIFGSDADVISWDFAMTDGRLLDRKGMYANRAGLNPNRPAIVDMFIDKFIERRTEELHKVGKRGLAALYLSDKVAASMLDAIPDTFGLSQKEIDAMPPFIRYFKCQGAIEKGDPSCDANKYDNDKICPDRKYMAPWHPGWKASALWGNMLGLFLSNVLVDTVAELGSVSNPSELLSQLRQEEDADYKTFFESDVPDLESSFLDHVDKKLLNDASVAMMYRNPAICHTARLPAETRYLGILTETSDETGVMDYYKGISGQKAQLLKGSDMQMPLVYDESDRENCEVELVRDYKDYFFVSNSMGWSSLTAPNKAEWKAYSRDFDAKVPGVLIVCLTGCPWGKCPPGNLDRDAAANGQVKFEVNGQPVANITNLVDCFALLGEDSHVWKPNDDGQFVVRAKVSAGAGLAYLRISSVIILYKTTDKDRTDIGTTISDAKKVAGSEAAVANEDRASTQPSEEKDKRTQTEKGKDSNNTKDCAKKCLTSKQEHVKQWGGDLSNINDVERLVKEAYDKLVARLKVDYGKDYFSKIFQVDGTSRGRNAFVSADPRNGASIERFKRKLKMKVLTMQQGIRNSQSKQAECDCQTGSSEASKRKLTHVASRQSPDHDEASVRFVWATGGHSASAGHGNIFKESYTAYLEDAATDVFGAIGIAFEGRNHAMGGQSSGPEIALCTEQIFGTDADVISWDYGMTDSNWFFKQAMYEQRAGLNPNRPAVVGINIDGTFFKYRRDILKRVEDRGLTALYLSPDQTDAMIEAFPDTFGLSGDAINALPPLVRHFKCQGTVEKGEPTCGDMKFTTDHCPDRMGRTSWHPGWKVHSLYGNIVALFLSDVLLDVIAEIAASSLNPTELLAQLQKEEDSDYEKFIQPASPDPIELDRVPLDADLLDQANVSVFFRSPSICHTALLPSQTRYLGILTETKKESGIENYYKGHSIEMVKQQVSDNTTVTPMPLAYDESEREDCDVEVVRDFKDCFFVSNKMGWTSLTIPSEAEKKAYGRDSSKMQGVLVFCPLGCPWGRCPDGEIKFDLIVNGTVQVEVNSERVTNVTDFGGCSILRGMQGHRWKPNDTGQFDVRVKIVDTEKHELSFLRISSLIVL